VVPQAAVLTRASVRASVRACACAEGGKVAPWVGDDGQTFAMADIWPLTKRHEGGATPVCTRDPVPVQMWKGRAQSRCRCGRMGRVPVQMWAARATSIGSHRLDHGVAGHVATTPQVNPK
jgi:hypothetical protein